MSASGDEPACAYRLKTDSSRESGLGGVLRKCVREDCATTCVGDGSFHQRCMLQNGAASCTCSDSPNKMGDACSKEAVKSGRCYETEGGCVCGHFSCRTKRDGLYSTCTCDLSGAVEGGPESDFCSFESLGVTPSTPRDNSCCLTRSGPTVSCKCERINGDCASGGKRVPSCDRDYLLNTALKPYATNVCSK